MNPMKIPTHINFLGERIEGNFEPMEVLEMLDKRIVEIKKEKEGV